jgi:hypothetical protein
MREHACVSALSAIVAPMRWGALLILAACGGGTGVDIDIFVPGDTNIDRIELWVAYDRCYDCPNGVAWTQSERASGDINFLRDEKMIRAVEQGDRWVIHLDAESGYNDVPWIVIAGFTGTSVTAVKVLRNVRIPASTVVTWQVYLHPAEPATTDLVTPPADLTFDHRAHVWAREATPDLAEPTGCLAYQKWIPETSTWETEYFVPKSDPDCDGFPIDKECSEYWYQYKPVGSCVSHSFTRIPNACAIGLSPCADGVTSDKTCGTDPLRSFTCLPDAFCNYCGDQIPADTCIARAVSEGITSNALTRYECAFDAQSSGEPCLDEHASMQLPWVNAFCGAPTLHTVDAPFTNPQTTLAFGVAPNEVKLFAKQGASTCMVDLYWTGGTIATFKEGITFLLEVPYDNATRAIYPITIKPSNQVVTCSSTVVNVCMPMGPTNDNVGLCAAAP